MHPLAILQSLALLALANGTPIFVKKLAGARFALALDGGRTFCDGRPLLGRSKTVRGLLSSILVTALAAPLIGIDMGSGALWAAAAMAGDLLSSFVKRRLGLPASSQALGLDQVPEALLPLLLCGGALGLTALDGAVIVALFFAGELLLSRLLYRAHLRDVPY